MIGTVSRRVLAVGSLLAAVILAGCGGGGGNDCNGIVNSTKSVTTDSAAFTLDIGATRAVTGTPVGFCGTPPTITWTTASSAIVTVAALGTNGTTVTGIAAGTTTITGTASDNTTRVTVAVTVRPRIAGSIDVRPNVDTLFPTGTRALTVTVNDQNGVALAGAPIVWRSITPNLASVSATGTVTAVAVGTARIVATTPRTSPTDSLSDTTAILIVEPCTLVRPITFGSTYNGTIDGSSCKNFLGFPVVDQFSLTSATQAYYSIQLTPTFLGSIVPINIGSGFYGLRAPRDTTTLGLAVMRAGTFGFLVANATVTSGTYRVTTTLNPDPRQSCGPTDVTTGVNFQTAVTPTCQQRDIRVLPTVAPAQVFRVTATALSFPTAIELRNFSTNALLANASATSSGATATINYTNTTGSFQFVYVRVFGGPVQNDLVTIVISP